MDKLFSSLPRIAATVFGAPWMILPEFHRSALVPQLLAAIEAPDRFRMYDDDGGDRDPHARQKELNAKLCAASTDEWAIAPDAKKARIAYNVSRRTGVAQIYVDGVIGKALGSMDMSCGGVCVDHLQTALDHVAEYKPKAVALHLNSPGGTVTGVPETAAAIREFATSVAPVHAYTDTMACSAAYYLGSAADTFRAAASADVGSIGVYCAVLDSSAAYAQEGLTMHLIASGAYKGQGMRGVPVSESFLAALRADVTAHADRFFGQVIGSRGAQIEAEAAALTAASGQSVSREAWAAAIMQGQKWTVADAPRALVDGIDSSRRAHLAWVEDTLKH
jgi:ClpP class serine protease